MQVTLKATNFTVTAAIAEYLSRKLDTIDRLLSRLEHSVNAKRAGGRALVTARIEIGRTTRHHRKGMIFRAEANLDVPGQKMLRAQAEGETLHLAIDRMRDELQQEIRRWKGRNTRRARDGGRTLKSRIHKV